MTRSKVRGAVSSFASGIVIGLVTLLVLAAGTLLARASASMSGCGILAGSAHSAYAAHPSC